MAGEWPVASLDDLRDPNRIITYGIVKVGSFVDDGVPVIRGGDIRDGVIVFDDAKRVSEEVSNQFSRTILRGGELVTNLISDPGHVAIVPNDFKGFNVSRDVAVVPLGKDCDHRFVMYVLQAQEAVNWLNARLQGSVTEKINLSTLREIPIPQPSLHIQHKIAGILGDLDDKIELNRQMNRTLEKMAQAIFKSWFIDFDPVRAKAAGRDPGLPKEIADLFPDSFQDSELGEIPKGWEVKSLDEVADFLNGLVCQKFPAVDGEPSLPVIKIRELRQGISDNTDRATPNVPAKYLVNDGDVLFSWSGSLLVDVWTKGQGVLNQHVFKVTSSDYPKWFFFYWTAHHLAEFQRIAADKATTMGHIKRHHLSDAKVSVRLLHFFIGFEIGLGT